MNRTERQARIRELLTTTVPPAMAKVSEGYCPLDHGRLSDDRSCADCRLRWSIRDHPFLPSPRIHVVAHRGPYVLAATSFGAECAESSGIISAIAAQVRHTAGVR